MVKIIWTELAIEELNLLPDAHLAKNQLGGIDQLAEAFFFCSGSSLK